MLPRLALRHGAVRVCALICLSLLLLASFCAPIHKHDNSQKASCLSCHATTRTEWLSQPVTAGRPFAAVSYATAKHVERPAMTAAECMVRIPRAPPTLLLSL
jgi:hypothetical protein